MEVGISGSKIIQCQLDLHSLQLCKEMSLIYILLQKITFCQLNNKRIAGSLAFSIAAITSKITSDLAACTCEILMLT